MAVAVPAECIGGMFRGPLVALDYTRHDVAGIPDL